MYLVILDFSVEVYNCPSLSTSTLLKYTVHPMPNYSHGILYKSTVAVQIQVDVEWNGVQISSVLFVGKYVCGRQSIR